MNNYYPNLRCSYIHIENLKMIYIIFINDIRYQWFFSGWYYVKQSFDIFVFF